MSAHENAADIRAIEAIIDRQFGSLNWKSGGGGDWHVFAGDFHPEASLFPSARPARRQSVEAFIERMKCLAQGPLHIFTERVLGTEVHTFGNVAVALAACEIVENEEKTSRGVEALLLVKDENEWRIVAQAWDMERDGNPIPERLLP
jgi:hypothetical protein